MKHKAHHSSYLDVSQLVLKQHSPLFKPRPTAPPLEINSSVYELNQDASPVIDGKMSFSMTPLFDRNKLDPFKDSNFDQLDSFSLDAEAGEQKHKRGKKNRPRLPSSWYIVQNELEGIIEEKDQQNADLCQSDQQSVSSNQGSNIQNDNESNSQQQIDDEDADKIQNTFNQQSVYQFKCPQWQAQNPKKQLINKLKSAINDQTLKTDDERIAFIIDTFQKYLCQHEKFYFQEVMNVFKKQMISITQLVTILTKGIQQTFKRQIRGLSFQKRRLKLLRYLDKKKRRVWKKKVSYDCRKKVADGRLRIKGKFVTHQQACQQLGLASVEGYTPQQIKEMLYKRLEQS